MLRKIGRWASARLQGSKGVKKYDTWMKKNPWARTALGAGDLALMFYGPGLVGKGLSKLGTSGRLANTAVGRGAASAGKFLTGQPGASVPGPYGAQIPIRPKTPSAMQRLGGAVRGGARTASDFAKANPLVASAALQSIPELYSGLGQAEQQRRIADMTADEMRRRAEQREKMMELLAPLFLRIQQGV